MPARLRPTAPLAPDAILVGDPGRALLLAQALLEEPKMSNHARGLWGYSGPTPAGTALTIQATGIGGPSAATVLADLAELGVRRAVRVGTCAALNRESKPGELLLAEAAVAMGGSAASFGVETGAIVLPDPGLQELLAAALEDDVRAVTVASFDSWPAGPDETIAAAADMQTVAVLARGRALGMATAAVLIVEESAGGEVVAKEKLEETATRGGRAAALALSNPEPEG
jgi:purine-nucleoside phosphorylase